MYLLFSFSFLKWGKAGEGFKKKKKKLKQEKRGESRPIFKTREIDQKSKQEEKRIMGCPTSKDVG